MANLIPEPIAERAEAACRKAVELWGTAPQFRMAQEECAELVAAINRFDRGRPDSLSNLMEEIADVSLVLLQLRLMVGSAIEDKQVEKLERLEMRLAHWKKP